jgi:RND superfamily putative drug exporter
MLEELARVLLRRRVLVLVLAVATVGLAGVFGAGVVAKLRSGGFQDPAASSTRAEAALRDVFHTGEPNLVLLVTAGSGTVDQAKEVSGGLELTRRLAAEPGISEVQSYWTTRAAPLRSNDGRQALVLARIAGDDDATQKRAERLATSFERDDSGMRVQVGGQARVFGEVSDQVERDLTRAEAIAVPITLLLLVLVFSSAVAGALPLAVGGLAIVGTLLVLRLLAGLTDVSVYALNLTTALGLGLAIDYSMFIVSRYREELRAGQEPAEALVTTMRTAGRTVLFSAATVAVALVALLVFPLYFLRSFGYAGIAVVALAAVGALVVLPALLAVLGRRIDSLRLPFGRRARAAAPVASGGGGAGGPRGGGAGGPRGGGAGGPRGGGAGGPGGPAHLDRPAGPAGVTDPGAGTGAWHRIATAVMRRPVPIATAVVAVLLVLGAPFLGARFGLPDDRVLPASATSRQVADAIRADFTARDADALQVVATGIGAPGGRALEIDAYAASLSRLDGVAHVDAMTGAYAHGHKVEAETPRAGGTSAQGGGAVAGGTSAQGGGAAEGAQAGPFLAAGATWLRVVPTVEAYSSAGESLVERVRALPAPFAVEVGGPSAQLVDTKAAISDRLPMAVAVIAGATLLLLFLMTGSLVIPFKALILNLLSLSAVYGAMVFVFQEGHLSGLLGFTPTGTIDTSMPVLLSCIAFGLSMDYEVFLLSRIKEEYDRTGDTVSSVAAGLERSGRIVTTLAALLAIVFVAFATSQVTFLKLFGIGSALAIVVDATLIRALLVPAFMRLAGRANWWAPRPLRLLHDRIGLREDVPRRVPEVTRT